MTITYVPAAADDSDLDNAYGTDVNVAVLANDNGDFAAGSVRILDGATPVMSLPVPGEGTWIVEADDTVTFHPEAGFLTDPTPVSYRVTDTTGDHVDRADHGHLPARGRRRRAGRSRDRLRRDRAGADQRPRRLGHLHACASSTR